MHNGQIFEIVLDSPFRDDISRAILQMQENSELEVLKDKWWKKSSGICGSSSQDANSEMGMANVGGVFVVLAGGIGLSFFVAALEFIWKIYAYTKTIKVECGISAEYNI